MNEVQQSTHCQDGSRVLCPVCESGPPNWYIAEELVKTLADHFVDAFGENDMAAIEIMSREDELTEAFRDVAYEVAYHFGQQLDEEVLDSYLFRVSGLDLLESGNVLVCLPSHYPQRFRVVQVDQDRWSPLEYSAYLASQR